MLQGSQPRKGLKTIIQRRVIHSVKPYPLVQGSDPIRVDLVIGSTFGLRLWGRACWALFHDIICEYYGMHGMTHGAWGAESL